MKQHFNLINILKGLTIRQRWLYQSAIIELSGGALKNAYLTKVLHEKLRLPRSFTM